MHQDLISPAKHRGNRPSKPSHHQRNSRRQPPLEDELRRPIYLPADAWDWDGLDDEPLPEPGDFWIEIEDSEI